MATKLTNHICSSLALFPNQLESSDGHDSTSHSFKNSRGEGDGREKKINRESSYSTYSAAAIGLAVSPQVNCGIEFYYIVWVQ